MIDPNVTAKLNQIAEQVRAALPGYRGCVEFHMPSDPGRKVLVDLKLCDVTGVKK